MSIRYKHCCKLNSNITIYYESYEINILYLRVSKKIGNAVTRNKLKRRIRMILKDIEVRMLISIRANYSYDELKSELLRFKDISRLDQNLIKCL